MNIVLDRKTEANLPPFTVFLVSYGNSKSSTQLYINIDAI